MPDSTPDYEKLIAEARDSWPDITASDRDFAGWAIAHGHKLFATIEALQGEVTRLTKDIEAVKSVAEDYDELYATEQARADAAEEVAEQYREALDDAANCDDDEICAGCREGMDTALAAKPTGALTRLRTQRAALIKAWDAWYDGPETRVPNELVEAMVALKEAVDEAE